MLKRIKALASKIWIVMHMRVCSLDWEDISPRPQKTDSLGRFIDITDPLYSMTHGRK